MDGRKSDKMGVTAVALLSGRATKQKLQLYKKQCLMDRDCHGERLKLSGEKKLGENFSFFLLISTSVSHSHDIKPTHLYICLLPKGFGPRSSPNLLSSTEKGNNFLLYF